MKSRGWIMTLGAVIVAAFSLTWLASTFADKFEIGTFSWSSLSVLGVLAIAMAVLIAVSKQPSTAKLKHLLPGLVVVAGLFALYGYRDTLVSMRSGLSTGSTATAVVTTGEVTIRASRDGHFVASAMVNGTHVDLLVDTGATVVALTEFDALRLGFSRNELVYDRPMSTANGQTFAAAITLDAITIGDIEISNVRGVVLEEGLAGSLLGMSFLNQLRSFTVDQDRLIMRR